MEKVVANTMLCICRSQFRALRPIYTLRFVVPICWPWEIVKQISAFVLVFVVGISFVKKAGIFRPLWYKKVDLLFIKWPFFPSRFTSTSAISRRDTYAWAVKSAPTRENLWSDHRFFLNRPTCRTEITRASGRHLHTPICFTISRGRQIGTTNCSV